MVGLASPEEVRPDEGAAANSYIEEQNLKFSHMLEAIAHNRFDEYQTKGKLLKDFGDPVFCRPLENSQPPLDECLYRYHSQFFGSDKVYLYFDKDEKLNKWVYEKGTNG